jgi:hypothetical protein
MYFSVILYIVIYTYVRNIYENGFQLFVNEKFFCLFWEISLNAYYNCFRCFHLKTRKLILCVLMLSLLCVVISVMLGL